MSVSDTGPRPRPTDTTYPGAPLGGPGRRPPSKSRGRWALVAVVVLAALVIGWVLTHRNAPAAGGAGGGGGGPPGATGGRGGGGGGRGGGGGGGMGGVTSVNAAKAATSDVPVYVTALGTVTPAATVTVRTQLAGQLFNVNFREGQTVSKGQVLAQVDPRPYQQALAQAQGNLQRDQATLANAQLDLKRYQTLLAQDSIARQTVDTQASTVRQAQGTVTFDKAAVAAAQLNLNYTRITAPVSGRVGLRQVDAGNYVSNGDTNGIVTITQVNPIDVVFTVPEDQISAVAKGMHAGAVPVTVFDRGQTEALAEGTLLTLDNQIDTTTGTVKAKARFANAGDTLFPNQFVNVRVLVDTLKSSVTVPTSAIQRGQNGLFVYTVDNSNTVHMTAVTTGPAVGENTAIASGLQAGTTVVTDGSDRLREGSRVLLPGDCAPTGGAAGGRGGRGGAAGAPGAAGAEAEKPRGNWFTNLFGGKKKDDAATGAAGAPGAAGGRHRGGAGAGASGQSRMGVGPDGQRCRSVDLSKGPAGAAEARTNAMLDQLGLSPDQKAKIQKIREAGREKMTAAMASGDFAAMRAGRTAISQQMEAVMTPAQRTKYEELRAQMQAQAAAGGGFGGMGGGAPGRAPPTGGAAGGGGAAPAATTSTSTSTTTSTTTRGPVAAVGSPTATPAASSAGGRGGAGGPGGGGRGAGMFAELGLSPAQQAKIDAVRAEYGPKMREAYGSGDMATAKSAGEEMRAKMEAVMTPEQRTKAAAIRERMRAQGGGPGGAF